MPFAVESLTREQIDLLPVYAKKWTDIGLSTAPADRPRAEAAINKAYECAGLNPPKQIVWCSSPLSMMLTKVIVIGLGNIKLDIGPSKRAQVGAQVGDQVWDQVGDQVWDQVRDQVRAQVRAQVGDQVGAQVGAQVWDQVWDQVGAQVWDQVWAQVGAQVWDQVGAQVGDQVWDQVRDQVRAQVRAQVGDQVWDQVGAQVRAQVGAQVGAQVWACCYGQHDANWLAFYEYFAQATKLDSLTQKLAGHWEAAQSVGWWLPHENVCWASERHNVLNRDEDGRLHCETGPALSYLDGWSIWAINGVRVDEQVVIRPESQTVKQITDETNEEVKRVRMERYGRLKYLQEVGAKSIDKRVNDVDGTTEELMRLPDGSQFLSCQCRSTGRKYAVGVSWELRTCVQAQSWMAGGSSLAIVRNIIGAS